MAGRARLGHFQAWLNFRNTGRMWLEPEPEPVPPLMRGVLQETNPAFLKMHRTLICRAQLIACWSQGRGGWERQGVTHTISLNLHLLGCQGFYWFHKVQVLVDDIILQNICGILSFSLASPPLHFPTKTLGRVTCMSDMIMNHYFCSIYDKNFRLARPLFTLDRDPTKPLGGPKNFNHSSLDIR